jgi:multiple sugar transport system permease protein
MTFAKRCRITAKYVTIGIVAFIGLIPVILTLFTSIKNELDAFAMPPKWVFVPTLENYIKLLGEVAFLRSILNSVIIAAGATFVATIIATSAAYTLSRFKFRGKGAFSYIILAFRAVPPIALVIPYYWIWRVVNLADTHFSMIVTYVAFCLPLLIWMIRSFFVEVPIEIEEAAMVDGCDRWQALRLILVPAIIPGIFASAILSFVLLWNEFMIALFITGRATRTLPIEIHSSLGHYYLYWGKLSSSAIVAIIPAIIFIAFAQKYIVRGLTMGAVKK